MVGGNCQKKVCIERKITNMDWLFSEKSKFYLKLSQIIFTFGLGFASRQSGAKLVGIWCQSIGTTRKYCYSYPPT
jgi:hypothetical protein